MLTVAVVYRVLCIDCIRGSALSVSAFAQCNAPNCFQWNFLHFDHAVLFNFLPPLHHHFLGGECPFCLRSVIAPATEVCSLITEFLHSAMGYHFQIIPALTFPVYTVYIFLEMFKLMDTWIHLFIKKTESLEDQVRDSY